MWMRSGQIFLAVASASLLGGCNAFTSVAQERISGYASVFETKFEETVGKTTDKVVATVSSAIGSVLNRQLHALKNKLATSVSGAITDWFDEHLPAVNPETLTDEELEALLVEHPELGKLALPEGSCDYSCPEGDCQEIIIRAAGENYSGWPKMRVLVNGKRIATQTVEANRAAGEMEDYVFTGDWGEAGPDEVKVFYINDYAREGKGDRNLFVDWIQVNGIRFQSNADGVTYERTNEGDTIEGQALMGWKGTLVFPIEGQAPAPVVCEVPEEESTI
jgi:hypothetical protein